MPTASQLHTAAAEAHEALAAAIRADQLDQATLDQAIRATEDTFLDDATQEAWGEDEEEAHTEALDPSGDEEATAAAHEKLAAFHRRLA